MHTSDVHHAVSTMYMTFATCIQQLHQSQGTECSSILCVQLLATAVAAT